MSNLLTVARGRRAARSTNPWPAITLDQIPYWFAQFGYQGLGYGPQLIQTLGGQKQEKIAADFTGFINGAYKTNGAIFTVMLVRMMLFSEVTFSFQRYRNGRSGQLFGTKDLQILEEPWPGGSTGQLLTRAINDVDLSGNFYMTKARRPDKRGMMLARMRPDWTTIILGSMDDPDLSGFDPTAQLIGYIYEPGGPGSGLKPQHYLPEEVCHWAPIPDPIARYRGMSWVQPILAEIMADKAMTTHKLMFLEGGATPNLVVQMPQSTKLDRQNFKEWVDLFETEHQGAINAWKTIYLANGADAKVIGTNLKEMDYGPVTSVGEARIAAAGRVPPIIAGFNAGLEAATYSNYGQARRHMADGTLRPLWRQCADSFAHLIDVPGGARLWYDDKHVAFVSEDQQDKATVQQSKAAAINSLVTAGYNPDSIIEAIEADDFTILEHSGMYSVQLQPPGFHAVAQPPGTPAQQPQTGQAQLPPGQPAPVKPTNGNGAPKEKAEAEESVHRAIATLRRSRGHLP